MKRLLGLFVPWAGFFLLWLLFVYQTSWSELLAGFVAAVLASVALQVVLRFEPLRFQPRPAWLIQIWRLPSIIVEDFRVLLRAFALRLARTPVPGTFQLMPFRSSGTDAHEGAKRAFAVLFLSVSPNSVVVGIDQDRGILLMHQLMLAPVPDLKRKLEEN